MMSLTALRPMLAQVVDFKNDRMQIVELDGLWRFHAGDDPQWADPEFDDSSWPLLRSNQPWTSQGYKGYGGMAWYRFKVLVPEKHGPLQFLIPHISTTYQVFADGRLIGGFGDMPPHQRLGNAYSHVFPFPSTSRGRVSIAIRVWLWPGLATYYGGGPDVAPFIGEQNRIDAWIRSNNEDTFWYDAARNILLLVYLLAALASLPLFLLRRAEREYLWFGLSELMNAAELLRVDYGDYYDTWSVTYQQLGGMLRTAGIIFFVLFLITLLKSRKGWLYWIVISALAALVLLSWPMATGWMSASTMYTIGGLLALPIYACLLMIPALAANRRVLDAQWLLPPVALSCAANSFGNIISVIVSSGRTHLTFDSFGWFYNLSSWPFPFSVQNVADLLVQLSILAILLMRFVRTRRDEQRMATELEAARMVQSVLIPSATPKVPGFSFEGVYKPALQVGGDFFQVIPNVESGVLVVIGDVSGKGMPAAMTVALLVGTIRSLAHYTQSPSEILSAMNSRMLTRSAGGFTTCLVLRVDSDGTLTLANAGHIAPYLNGVEFPLQNGLPLGLDATSVYVESTFRLAYGDHLTLMTDGVVEARNRTGELYGFDRAAQIASDSAESIARAAQEFGQEDDITVVTLIRVRQNEGESQDVSVSLPRSPLAENMTL